MSMTKPAMSPVDWYHSHYEFNIIPTYTTTIYNKRNYTTMNLLGDVAAVYTGISAIFGIILVKVC